MVFYSQEKKLSQMNRAAVLKKDALVSGLEQIVKINEHGGPFETLDIFGKKRNSTEVPVTPEAFKSRIVNGGDFPASYEDYKDGKRMRHYVELILRPYKDIIKLVDPNVKPYTIPGVDCGIWAKLTSREVSNASKSCCANREDLANLEEFWKKTATCKKLQGYLAKYGAKMRSIDRIVCLGLGPLNDSGAFLRHVAAAAIKTSLTSNPSEPRDPESFPIIAQDQSYCDSCKEILKNQLGITVVEYPNAFLYMDERTFVMTGLTDLVNAQLALDFACDFGGLGALLCDMVDQNGKESEESKVYFPPKNSSPLLFGWAELCRKTGGEAEFEDDVSEPGDPDTHLWQTGLKVFGLRKDGPSGEGATLYWLKKDIAFDIKKVLGQS